MKERGAFVKQKIFRDMTCCIILFSLMVLSLTGCGQKDIFGFLDVKIGDSFDEVVEKYGDDFASKSAPIYAYTNIEKAYECEEQYIAFNFDSDNNVDSLNATWTLNSIDEVNNLFDTLSGIASKQYGDDYEVINDSEHSKTVRWNDGSYQLDIICVNDQTNGCKVNISYHESY